MARDPGTWPPPGMEPTATTRLAATSGRAPMAGGVPTRGPALIGPALIGPALIGPALIGPALIGPALIGPALIGPAQIGPAPIGPALIGPAPMRDRPCRRAGPPRRPARMPGRISRVRRLAAARYLRDLPGVIRPPVAAR
jgi:hypothetical protein